MYLARSKPPSWYVYDQYFSHAMKIAKPRMIYGAFFFFDTEEERLTFKLAMDGETEAGDFRGIYQPILDILG